MCKARGGGVISKAEEQPHALGHASSQEMRRADTVGVALPIASDDQRSMQDAWGTFCRSAKGE
jgi:hypothetical protein